MKKIVEVTDVSGEGMESLLGETVIIFALNYIYTGVLKGVNSTCVLLENAGIVYETGAYTDKKFKDCQYLSAPHYIQLSAIESFGKTDKR
jgi:hypothetical protein